MPFCVCVGHIGKVAVISSFARQTPAENEALRLCAEYPDPRAEFWVSRSGVSRNGAWRFIEPLLSRELPASGAPAVFNRTELSVRRAIRAKKRRDDPKERLKAAVVAEVRRFLGGRSRRHRFMGFMPYTAADLHAHIASQFKPGMSWDNWGREGWHIDHIKPCALFDLHDHEQVKECWALSNLQPLWARENILKRDKYAA